MKLKMRDFDIAFVGLKLGEHRFDYQLNNEFFSLFDFDDFLRSELQAQALLLKKENGLNWSFKISGFVEVPCDVTNEPFELPMEHHMDLVVKYGEEYDDSKDEILIIPSGEHSMNIAQYLYEVAVLAVPLKRLSPKGKELQELEESQEIESENSGDLDEMDPRWQKLKDLLS